MLTFSKFLSIINEDNSLDKMVLDIQTAIGQIDTQINQRTKPLLDQKQQLQRRLGPLLKRKQQEDAKNLTGKQDQQDQQNQQPQMQAAASTPGSTQTSTPGTGNG